ncbi:unnamed protein product [Paramecium primaurelia]|uniref:Uncharacterized protein n=1 Tax=Paramecium primaurelia TaxID=5886 RepID=A0A8S1K615_PARPR|nr:unnamed protein product [Paramecium primaurelia]
MNKITQGQNNSQSDNGNVNKISDKQKISTVVELREEKTQLLKTIQELTQQNINLTKEKTDLDEQYNSVIIELQLQIQTLNTKKTRKTHINYIGQPQSLIQNDPFNNNDNLTKQIKQLQQYILQIQKENQNKKKTIKKPHFQYLDSLQRI